jgi:coenzyme F420-reducing hydrogenase delta subunit
MTTPDNAISEGKILILATETCAYPGANSVGQAHSSYPANTYIMRVRAPVLFPEQFYLDCFNKRNQRNYHYVLRRGMPV